MLLNLFRLVLALMSHFHPASFCKGDIRETLCGEENVAHAQGAKLRRDSNHHAMYSVLTLNETN